MKSVIKLNQAGKPARSRINNCTVISRGGTLFTFTKTGATVTLDSYLICPMEVFSKRQLSAALKKYHAAKAVS